MMAASQDEKLETLAGRVTADTVLAGTASEHTGIVLETENGERVRLQRIGGNPFSDEVTKSLVGRTVSIDGFRVGDIFRFVKVHDD
jgi:hypothetical protein